MANNEERQLLQQITYLSRLINRHKNANNSSSLLKITHSGGNLKPQAHFRRHTSNKIYIRRPNINDKVSPINETQNKNLCSGEKKNENNVQDMPPSKPLGNNNDSYKYAAQCSSSTLKTEASADTVSATILVNPQFASNKILINPHFNNNEKYVNNYAVKTRQKLIRGHLMSPTKTSSNSKKLKKNPKTPSENNKHKYLNLSQLSSSVRPINNKKFVRRAQVATVTNDQVTTFTENKASGPLISLKNNKTLVRQSQLIEEQNNKNKSILRPVIKKKLISVNSGFKSRHKSKKSIQSCKQQLKLDHSKKKKQLMVLTTTQNRSQFKLDHRNKLKTDLPSTPTTKKRSFVSQVKQKSIATLINKLRKNNKPCVFYRRFGKCTRPLCNSVHDPKQISLCKKFLMGKCELTGCLLSHDVVPEKVPTCEYFLAGCCNRINCPYLHVKVNSTADICMKFLSGYCDFGSLCKKRHVNICPEFEKNGSCKLGKSCMYPHKILGIRNSEKFVTIEENDNEKIVTNNKTEKKIYRIKNSTSRKAEKSDQESNIIAESRYFQGSGDSNAESKESVFITAPKREKLGKLPAFIPL